MQQNNIMRFSRAQRSIITAIVLFCLIQALPAVSAEVYKYIDEKGEVQYSDHPYTYRQKNFKPGQENQAYNKQRDTLEVGEIKGLWKLIAHSLHLGSDTLPDSGKWQFNENGSLVIQEGDLITHSKYRSQGHILEIIKSGKWSPYRIVSLSPDRLVIRQGDGGEYFYFKKDSVGKPVEKTMKVSLYRRDQVAILVTMFSCTGINFGELSEEEKKDKIKEIFTATGIEKFDEKTFNDSVNHYKKDAIFKEQYEPKIASEIKNCLVPKFDTE